MSGTRPGVAATARGIAAVAFRASNARAHRRLDAGEQVLACSGCGTEVDVPEPAHSPRCTNRTTADATITVEPSKPMEVGRHGWKQSGDERAPDGSLTIGEMNRRHDAAIDAKATATACAWCSWTFTGTAAEGREAAAEHRATAHADRAPKKKTRRPGTQFPARLPEIAQDANRVRGQAAKLRAQAAALDVIAQGIDQLADTV